MDYMNNRELRQRIQARIKAAFPYNNARAPLNKHVLRGVVANEILEWQAEMLLLDMERKMELP